MDGRRIRLEPGATARFRIEPLAPGEVRLAARADGPGKLELGWAAIDRADGSGTPRDAWSVEVERARDVERRVPCVADGSLLELCLAWTSGAGARLDLSELTLRESTPVQRPSFLLVSIDTLSAAHLACYGYALNTAPELERLAAESFVFDRCLTNAPWTVPSFMALHSGLYGNAHELDTWGPELWEHWHVAPNRWVLAEFLRAAGYRTGGYVDSLWLGEEFGFQQGFESYDNSASKKKTLDDGIRMTTAQARAFLERLPPSEPFFLFVHGLDVHGPYIRAPEDSPGSTDGRPERTALAGGPPPAFGIIHTYIARGEVPSGPLPSPMPTGPLERAYDAGIRFTDGVLGEFFAYLRASGVLEHSWVIVTADHGETGADSSYLFGHGVLDQDVVHVPLLIRPPGGLEGPRHVADTVQLVDLYPTIVALTGSGARMDHLHGRSLMPLLEGGTLEAGVVLSEGGHMAQSMLVAGGWKLVELRPGIASGLATMLTFPGVTRAWFDETEASLTREERAKETARMLAWKGDPELVRDCFERLPATGMTDELVEQMGKRAGFQSLLAFLRWGLREPVYQIYDLGTDPRARRDVAADYPEKVAELRILLEREQARRQQAKENAHERVEPVSLPAQDVEILKGLGYGGSADD